MFILDELSLTISGLDVTPLKFNLLSGISSLAVHTYNDPRSP